MIAYEKHKRQMEDELHQVWRQLARRNNGDEAQLEHPRFFLISNSCSFDNVLESPNENY